MWCNLHPDSSVKIQCRRQWRISQTQRRLAHWRRRQRCIKVIQGHCSTGLLEWYPAARRRRVMVRSHRRRPMRRISWEFNLGLGTEFYKHESFSATIGLPVCRAGFKILPMAPCVTPVIRSISTTYRRLSWGSQTLSCNVLPEIWRGIVWILQNLDQKVASIDGIRVKLIPFAHSVDRPRWFLMNLLIQSCMKWIGRAIPYRNPLRPLPEIGAICFEINCYQLNPFCNK